MIEGPGQTDRTPRVLLPDTGVHLCDAAVPFSKSAPAADLDLPADGLLGLGQAHGQETGLMIRSLMHACATGASQCIGRATGWAAKTAGSPRRQSVQGIVKARPGEPESFWRARSQAASRPDQGVQVCLCRDGVRRDQPGPLAAPGRAAMFIHHRPAS